MHNMGSYTFRLWRTTNLRSIQKHTSYKVVFSSIPYRRFKAAVEMAKRILTKEKIDRQLAGLPHS